MKSIKYLHITDLHAGQKNQDWLWPGVKAEFFEDLSKIVNQVGHLDLVFFTGDLVQSGLPEEFSKLDDILNQIWDKLDDLGCSDIPLIPIPGNHDLVRQETNLTDLEREEFWLNPNSAQHIAITKAFSNYTSWVKECKFTPKRLDKGLMPGDFSYTFNSNGIKLGILGLNSAFLQLTGKNYFQKLAVHPRQFHDACNGDGPEWANKHHACILLTHHPREWLSEQYRQYLEAEITDHGRFAVHLCGHMHENKYRRFSDADTEPQTIWQGCSLFGLQYYGKQKSRSHGYMVGELKFVERTEGQVIFSPRVSYMRGTQRDMGSDRSIVSEDQSFTNPQSFKLNMPMELRMPIEKGILNHHGDRVTDFGEKIQRLILEGVPHVDDSKTRDYLIRDIPSYKINRIIEDRHKQDATIDINYIVTGILSTHNEKFILGMLDRSISSMENVLLREELENIRNKIENILN